MRCQGQDVGAAAVGDRGHNPDRIAPVDFGPDPQATGHQSAAQGGQVGDRGLLLEVERGRRGRRDEGGGGGAIAGDRAQGLDGDDQVEGGAERSG